MAAAKDGPDLRVRNTRPGDLADIIRISRQVYPDDHWVRDQLVHHLRVFPEGQLVAVDPASDRVLGMAASLIILWEDYAPDENWREFTDKGRFTNHDPQGKTLYGAEVMVDPTAQRRGVGSALYAARRDLVQRLGLRRIRAHSRLAGYHAHAARMSAREYVDAVVAGELRDPPLSFQIRWGFRVLGVVSGYLRNDPGSLGWAALIEWLNDEQPLLPDERDA